jgi:tetratricopeptide (TPR) repeat protein
VESMRRASSFRGVKAQRAARAGAAVSLALGLCLGVVARADTIEKMTGDSLTDIEVKDAKWDVVTYALAGGAAGKADTKTKKVVGAQKVDGFTVVVLDRASPRLSGAKGALENGDYAKAEELLPTAGEDWEKAEAAYLKGRLNLEWSGTDSSKRAKAIAAFTEYLAAYKDAKDFYVPFAVYGLGKAYLADGKYKEALEQFKSLAEFGGARGIWGPRAKIGEGWTVLREKGQTGANVARKAFTEVLSDKALPFPLVQEASTGRAASFTIAGQYDDAITFLNQTFFEAAKTQHSEYYGEACNLMGDAYRGKKSPQEAELWYLRTTCFFKRYPAVYKNAAKGLVEIYKELGKSDRAKEWEPRAGN